MVLILIVHTQWSKVVRKHIDMYSSFTRIISICTSIKNEFAQSLSVFEVLALNAEDVVSLMSHARAGAIQYI